MQSGAGLHAAESGAAGEGSRVGGGGEVSAQQVVFAVPVRAMREASVGDEGGEGVRACGVEFVLGGEMASSGEPGADGGGGEGGDVTVLVAVGAGGGEAEAAGAGEGQVAGVEGDEVHRLGDAVLVSPTA